MTQQRGPELKLGETEIAHMKVGAQIVEHLSKGIYTTPAQAIKELIINAFDADATKVIVRARPEFDTLTISDNGSGMNSEGFKKQFLTLSRSDRRDHGEHTETHRRPIVGKFGIGFVAVSQICDNMTVISSKKGEPFKLEADIDFSKFREIEHRDKEFYELSEVSLTNFKEEKDVHYTVIVLSKLVEGILEYLIDKRGEDKIKTADLEELSFTRIIDYIDKQASMYKSGFDLDKKLGKYWQMLLEIANTVPVRYLDDGPIQYQHRQKQPKEWSEVIQDIVADVDILDFTVDFDGVYLRKPIRFPNKEQFQNGKANFDVFVFQEDFSFEVGSNLRFRGYLYNQDSSIYPPQMRGILIRIKNTAIGRPDAGFMDYVFAEKMYQNWTFGEIYIDAGLEDAMNISRSSFNTAHPHYQKLRNYLHELLHKKIFRRSRERYTKRKKDDSKRELLEIKTRLEKRFSEAIGQTITVKWTAKKCEYPIEFLREKRTVLICTSHPLYRKLRKKQRPIVQAILVLFLESYEKSEGSAEELFSAFLQALDKWDFRG